jgi:hypothetical protein
VSIIRESEFALNWNKTCNFRVLILFLTLFLKSKICPTQNKYFSPLPAEGLESFWSGKQAYDSFEYLIYWLRVIRSRREKHARDWTLRCFSASRTTVILFLWCAQHTSKVSLLCEKLAFDISVSIFLVVGNPHVKICHHKSDNLVISAEIELELSFYKRTVLQFVVLQMFLDWTQIVMPGSKSLWLEFNSRHCQGFLCPPLRSDHLTHPNNLPIYSDSETDNWPTSYRS